jgi:predicted alpha-1,2-mannosidase
VNPLIGTDSNYKLSNGNTYPSIALPFGMTSWTPQTAEEHWIYTYKADSLQGLRATHQPSPWIADYGNFSVMPVTGNLRVGAKDRASKFNHEKEKALPYYYRVELDRYHVTAELTPTMRCSYIRFTFPRTDSAYVLIDAHPAGAFVNILPEENKVVGYTRSNSGGAPDNFACYFVALFDKGFISHGTWSASNIQPGSNEKKGEHVGAFVQFKTDESEVVQLKIGTSFISIEQAEKNLKQEIGKKEFNEIKHQAQNLWNKELNKIQIEGATEEQNIIFYSAFYRCLLFPRVWYEFDGNGEPYHFSPYDGKVYPGFMYTDTGFWDTYRAVFPFFTILYPQRDIEIIQSLLNAYDEGGWLPKWMSPGYRDAMIGTHTASVIVDAYFKGIRDFDVNKAYEAMWKDAMVKSEQGGRGRLGIEYYKTLGYIPTDKIKEATSRTLEFAYDDFCVAQMAKALGKEKDYEIFIERAKNYRNVYDETTSFMRGRNRDGSWLEPFNPIEWGGTYTEGCAWQYSWSVQHDVQGLINLMGGRKIFSKKLDALFSTPSHFVDVGSYKRIIHEMTEMVLADMGQYAHGNEPVHHVIYLYNYAGQPWKAQKWARRVMEELYGPGPDGYCGDEDNGQMSAWYIFSVLGFYPVCPGEPFYAIGSPLFKKTTLYLPNARTFIIEATDNSKSNRFIQSAKLNGENFSKTWISHSTIINGGKLEFIMGPQPNKNWGSGIGDAPFSLTKN